MIPQRALGATGLHVSAIGFGVSGPLGAAAVSDAQVARLVDAALAGGVSLFDTAPFYGRAEARLGQALRGAPRARFAVISKAGKTRTPHGLFDDYGPEAVAASVARSCETLGVERLDILLLHGPAPHHLTAELLALLQSLAAKGVIGGFGVCARDAGALRAASERGFAAVVQLPAFSAEAAAAADAGAGVIGIEAMRAAAPGLRLSLRPADLWYGARAIKLKQLGPRRERPADALARALALPHLASVLVTTTRLDHLRENLKVAAEAAS